MNIGRPESAHGDLITLKTNLPATLLVPEHRRSGFPALLRHRFGEFPGRRRLHFAGGNLLRIRRLRGDRCGLAEDGAGFFADALYIGDQLPHRAIRQHRAKSRHAGGSALDDGQIDVAGA